MPPSPRFRSSAAAARAGWARWQVTAESLAILALSVLALTWLAQRSQGTRLGQSVDQAGMDLVVGGAEATTRLLGWLGVVSVWSIGLSVLGLAVVAVSRRRYAAAAAAATLVVGANLTTQVLKRLIERSDFGMLTVPSFPSGHATVITSVSLAALLVTPAALRATVSAVGTGAITVTAAAALVASWHRPADLIGAILVCLAWGSAIIAIWSLARGGVAHPAPHQHRLFSLVGFVVAVAGLVALGVRPEGGWTRGLDAGLVVVAVGSVAAIAVSAFAHVSTPMAGGRAPESAPDGSA